MEGRCLNLLLMQGLIKTSLRESFNKTTGPGKAKKQRRIGLV
jgi:hypothetical protein